METNELLRSFKTVMASAIRTRVRMCTKELVDNFERVAINNPNRNAGVLYADVYGEEHYFVFSSFQAMMELVPLIIAEEWDKILVPVYAGQLVKALAAYRPADGWDAEEERNYQRLIALLTNVLAAR